MTANRAPDARPLPEPPAMLPTLDALEPLGRLRRRWPTVLGIALSVAMLAGLVNALLDQGLGGLTRAVPRDPLFYLFFLLSYFTLPACDFVIFRRLWGVPPAAFGALNRKRILNDVLFGYLGDAYFYAWARARLKMVAAPFGAVKDVTIMSGLAGNASAVVLAAIALPLGYELIDARVLRTMLWSVALVGAVLLLVLAFSRRVFSLSRRSLWFVFNVDAGRIMLGAVLLALAWHYAMPSVSLFMWLFLLAGRQLVSRLPFLPNKDLLFANFAILVIGEDRALGELMAFTAASSLLLHLILTTAYGAGFALERMREWRRTG